MYCSPAHRELSSSPQGLKGEIKNEIFGKRGMDVCVFVSSESNAYIKTLRFVHVRTP